MYLTPEEAWQARSLPESELFEFLKSLPEWMRADVAFQIDSLEIPLTDERSAQSQLMARKRALARDIIIPVPVSTVRRIECLNDCQLFLQTYFQDVFFEPFTADRIDMMESIIRAARYGGDQAIAGTRGE